jgi:hypothetical protein
MTRPGAARGFGQGGALVGAELSQPLGQPGGALPARLLDDAKALVGDRHEDLTAVDRVIGAHDETGVDQGAEDAGHGRRLDALVVGQLARRTGPMGHQRTEHGVLTGGDVVVAALLAQASSQLHHGDSEVGRQGRRAVADGCRHVVSIPHYHC